MVLRGAPGGLARSAIVELCDVVLLVASRFVDDALEYPTHGFGPQRLFAGCYQAFDDVSLPVGVVDLHAMGTFDVADLQHVLESLVQQVEDLVVDAVDRLPLF